jgi:hypothetical protein
VDRRAEGREERVTVMLEHEHDEVVVVTSDRDLATIERFEPW